jgi:hypothetical protein
MYTKPYTVDKLLQKSLNVNTFNNEISLESILFVYICLVTYLNLLEAENV